MLDPAIKKAWLEALESGKYTKATDALVRSDADGSISHCCIGVLCEVVDPGHIQTTGTGIGFYAQDDSAKYAGLDELCDAVGLEQNAYSILVTLNDHEPGYPIQYIKDCL